MRILSNSLRAIFILLTAVRAVSAENTDKPVSAAPISSVQWHPSGKRVTYLKAIAGGRSALFAYDVDAGAEKVLYNPGERSTERAAGEAALTLRNYQWLPSGESLLISNENDYWLVSVPGGKQTRITRDAQPKESATLSPDAKFLAYVRENNLFAVEVSSGTARQLTFDGSDTILNATQDWVYEEELREGNPSGRAFAWSPDSKQIVYLRLDQAAVPEHPIVNILQTHPTVTKQRYPKSGDANSTPAVCVVELSGDATRTRRMSLGDKGAGIEYVLPEFSWTPDSKTVSVTTLNRGQNELTIFAWSPWESSEPRVLLQEKDAAWINVFGAPHFLAKNATSDGGFVWLSERDGWAHAYLYGANGTLTRQLTRGAWMIEPEPHGFSRQSFEIDAAQEWIYFSATEKDPRERQMYRARLDGTGNLERLSKEDGTHYQKLSPDGKYLLESFSSTLQPPLIRLLRTDGTSVATLHRGGNAVKNAPSEFHEFSAEDGTKYYARMTKPANFDASKKYPVLINVYGGPHVQVVRNSWGGGADGVDYRLAQDGYLIWSMDNRGSWGRGHAWETAIFKNMGAKELADQLAGIEYLKKLTFVDGSRIGIHGWSYGGYMTLYSLTHAPDAFKCGCAGAPVTDWKYYDTIYTERYMRTPKENPDGYVSSSPLAAAGKLKAKLLIIHGTSDDNVHIQNTMNFLDALTKANRPYELQIQPGQKHGFRGEAAGKFLSDRMVEFFKRNL